MKRIFVPTAGPDSWRQLLADPVKHWKPGASAHALATAWEAAGGPPGEVRAALEQSGIPALQRIDVRFMFPE
jgi:hypothetical protein